jgi:hypothetical protein
MDRFRAWPLHNEWVMFAAIDTAIANLTESLTMQLGMRFQP